jgi:uncharacterized membrane protein HdeD (DUF308 family)
MSTVVGNLPKVRAKLRSAWWIILLRGIAGALLGLLLFSQVSMNVVIMATFMALYWFIDGIFMVVLAFAARMPGRNWWWWMLGRGLLGILAGYVVYALVQGEAVASLILIWILAGIAILTGIIDLITNTRLRQYIEDEWAMALSAVMNVVFGVLMAISPAVAFRLIGVVMGFVALLGGIGMVIFSLRTMRKLGEPLP